MATSPLPVLSSYGFEWAVRRRAPKEAAVEQGQESAEAFVDAAAAFIELWKQLRQMNEQASPYHS